MYKKWLLLLFAFLMMGSTISAMHKSKDFACAAAHYGKNGVRFVGTYGMPITIGSVIALVLIYKFVPVARRPIYFVGAWIGGKLYSFYNQACYELQVRPIEEENRRLQAHIQQQQAESARLWVQGCELEQARGALEREINTQQQELAAATVKSHEINETTGVVRLVTNNAGRIADLVGRGFGAVNTNLTAALGHGHQMRQAWENVKVTLAQSLPYSDEETAAATALSATRRALDEREQLVEELIKQLGSAKRNVAE